MCKEAQLWGSLLVVILPLSGWGVLQKSSPFDDATHIPPQRCSLVAISLAVTSLLVSTQVSKLCIPAAVKKQRNLAYGPSVPVGPSSPSMLWAALLCTRWRLWVGASQQLLILHDLVLKQTNEQKLSEQWRLVFCHQEVIKKLLTYYSCNVQTATYGLSFLKITLSVWIFARYTFLDAPHSQTWERFSLDFASLKRAVTATETSYESRKEERGV